MTQAISKADYILETLKKLTPQHQQEVLDFIEFLHFKAQNQEQTPKEEPISMLEAASEFIGCVEGPPDLSMRKLKNLLQQQIISGKYTNVDELIEEALQLLEKRNQYNDCLEEIRQKIDIAVEKLDRGQGIDDEIAISQLKEYLDNLSLFLPESHQKNQTIQPKALELENQPFVGMWKNRPDMKDSSKWVRKLRQQRWQH